MRAFEFEPEVATSSTFTPRLCAMCPRIEKMTKPAKKFVTQFPIETMRVSLQRDVTVRMLFWMILWAKMEVIITCRCCCWTCCKMQRSWGHRNQHSNWRRSGPLRPPKSSVPSDDATLGWCKTWPPLLLPQELLPGRRGWRGWGRERWRWSRQPWKKKTVGLFINRV